MASNIACSYCEFFQCSICKEFSIEEFKHDGICDECFLKVLQEQKVNEALDRAWENNSENGL
jgi:hypothetical protein